MGTINYKTSDYITLAIKPYDYDDYKTPDFMEFIADEWGVNLEDDNEVFEAINEQMSIDYNCEYENAEAIMNKYDYYYFNVSLEYGYYEGFSLNLELEYNCFEDEEERAEATEEVRNINKMLLELSGVGMVACCPSWCTTYYNYEQTQQKIDEATKEMTEEVKALPLEDEYIKQVWGCAN